MTTSPNIHKITNDIIKVAFDIRNQYGSLMLESFYEQIMTIELSLLGYKVERQVPISIEHKGIKIERAYICDLLIEDQIIVELKAISRLGGDEFRQLLTYLKLGNKKLGYLINFGAKDFSFGKLKDEPGYHYHGLYRLIN